MKTSFYTFIFLLLSVTVFAQNITLYGLKGSGDPMNASSYSMNLVQINPTDGMITPLFEIDNSFAAAVGSSTFDHANGKFIYWGPDSQQDYRLFSVDVDDQTTLLAPITMERAIELEFDLETGITYGLLYDDATDTGFFGSLDLQNGTTQNIGTITGLESIAIGSSTYDSNNKRYIFYGVDDNFNNRLYTIDVLTGQILSNPIINPNDSGVRINFFEYDNNTDIMYGLYSDIDSTQYDPMTFMYYRRAYLAEIDLATGAYTILGNTPILEGFTVGTQVGGVAYDQATSSYVMRGLDMNGYRLFVINAINGSITSVVPADDNFGEIQVDNIAFAASFYVTSTEEDLKLEEMSIFPNPVQDQLNLELETSEIAGLKIQIVDITGRVVFENNYDTTTTQNISIPTSNLIEGNYFITIASDEGGVRTEKFIKK